MSPSSSSTGRFPIRRRNFGDSTINKGYIAYFSLRVRLALLITHLTMSLWPTVKYPKCTSEAYKILLSTIALCTLSRAHISRPCFLNCAFAASCFARDMSIASCHFVRLLVFVLQVEYLWERSGLLSDYFDLLMFCYNI